MSTTQTTTISTDSLAHIELTDITRPKPSHVVADTASEKQQQQDLDKEAWPLPDAPRTPPSEPSTPRDDSIVNVARQQQRWNDPPINKYRLAAVFWAFLAIGANDASYGALIPSIEAYYGLNYTVVSLIFLSPFVGYSAAALVTDKLHMRYGQRGNAMLGAANRLVSYIVLSVHPPYPVIVVFLALTGLGNGLIDAGFNAWVGDMASANQLMGILHAWYGLGATLAPIIATTMVNNDRLQWYTFYFIMVGVSSIELVGGTLAFWRETGIAFREKSVGSAEAQKSHFREALKSRVTWTMAAFLFAYTGAEVALGGWIVTFMIRVRHGQAFASGMTATGFWLGITVGRIVLGFITPRFGERWSIAFYLLCSLALELIFWLVPQFIVSAVAVALLGFFLGPMFPSAIIATTKLLPKRLHVGGVGFASALGGGGAAVLPFVTGAIAQAKGVQVLQPIVVALVAALIGLWLLLPKIPKHVHDE